MPSTPPHRTLLPVLLASMALLFGCQAPPSKPTDEKAVARAPVEIQRMARKNDCFKCHAVQREKDGPSWHSVAEKYRDKADAREKLRRHLTTAPIIDLRGDPEKHKQLEELSDKDIDALIDWILTL